MSISVLTVDPDATNVICTDDALQVTLSDGRIISVPLAWSPRLFSATPAQRKNWRFIADGVGIHWEEIDEDISVRSLFEIILIDTAMSATYPVILIKSEEGYAVDCPALPGYWSQGATEEEALQNIRAAIQDTLLRSRIR